MKKIIVLITSGKNTDVDHVKVKLFDSEEEANNYCKEVSDKDEQKYWKYAEIIEEDIPYEPVRYENF